MLSWLLLRVTTTRWMFRAKFLLTLILKGLTMVFDILTKKNNFKQLLLVSKIHKYFLQGSSTISQIFPHRKTFFYIFNFHPSMKSAIEDVEKWEIRNRRLKLETFFFSKKPLNKYLKFELYEPTARRAMRKIGVENFLWRWKYDFSREKQGNQREEKSRSVKREWRG